MKREQKYLYMRLLWLLQAQQLPLMVRGEVGSHGHLRYMYSHFTTCSLINKTLAMWLKYVNKDKIELSKVIGK